MSLCLCAFVVIVAPGNWHPPHSSVAKPPNIIFILADDLGWGHLGVYGQHLIHTPNLDRMAAEGIHFTQFYPASTVCAPARSVLMTGLHTGHTPIRANYGDVPLAPEDLTVAEVLQRAGYVTGLFGKWGLGDSGSTGVPWRQGFDEFFGYLNQVHAHDYYPTFLWDNQHRLMLPANAGGERATYSHDLITARALDFVQRHREGPFFLYLAYTIPHTHLEVPEDSYHEYARAFPEPHPFVGEGRAPPQPYPRAVFAAMVTRMDRDVGRLLTLLSQLGIDSNTVVFFASDNGAQGRHGGPDLEFFQGNDDLRGAKTQLYEGGIRVPMIVRWPGRVPPGLTSNHIWAFWDVFPTLAEIAGVASPPGIDGISQLAALVGREGQAPTHEYLYWEYGGQSGRKGPAQAVRMGRWKGFRPTPRGQLELYDLATDPDEKHDVARKHPVIVRRIEGYLKTARTPMRPYPRRLAKIHHVAEE